MTLNLMEITQAVINGLQVSRQDGYLRPQESSRLYIKSIRPNPEVAPGVDAQGVTIQYDVSVVGLRDYDDMQLMAHALITKIRRFSFAGLNRARLISCVGRPWDATDQSNAAIDLVFEVDAVLHDLDETDESFRLRELYIQIVPIDSDYEVSTP